MSVDTTRAPNGLLCCFSCPQLLTLMPPTWCFSLVCPMSTNALGLTETCRQLGISSNRNYRSLTAYFLLCQELFFFWFSFLLLGQPSSSKTYGSVISNRIGMKFDRNVLRLCKQLNLQWSVGKYFLQFFCTRIVHPMLSPIRAQSPTCIEVWDAPHELSVRG